MFLRAFVTVVYDILHGAGHNDGKLRYTRSRVLDVMVPGMALLETGLTRM